MGQKVIKVFKRAETGIVVTDGISPLQSDIEYIKSEKIGLFINVATNTK